PPLATPPGTVHPYLYPAPGSSARLAVVAGVLTGSRARPSFLPAPDRCQFSAGLAGGSRGAKRSHGDAAGALDAVARPAGRSAPGGREAADARRGIGQGRLRGLTGGW